MIPTAIDSTRTRTATPANPAAELEAARRAVAEAIEAGDASPSLAEAMLADHELSAARDREARAAQAVQEAAEAAEVPPVTVRQALDAHEAAKRDVARTHEHRDEIRTRVISPASEGMRQQVLAKAEAAFGDALDREREAAEALRLARGGQPEPIEPEPAEQAPTPYEQACEALGELIEQETDIRQQLDAAKAEREATGGSRAGPGGVDVLQKRYSKIMERRMLAEREVDRLTAEATPPPVDWRQREADERAADAKERDSTRAMFRKMADAVRVTDARRADRRRELEQLRREANAAGHGWTLAGAVPFSDSSPATVRNLFALLADLAQR